jgi:ligand-binding SRPBCC domain-containing protein
MAMTSTKVHVLEREQLIERPLETVFQFFSEARNLERITPSWLSFKVVTPGTIEMRPGALIEYKLSVHGVPLKWVSEIESWVENTSFVDRQVKGPYGLWHHTHEFVDLGGNGTLVRDRVRYSLPFGPFGEVAHVLSVQRDLDNVFAYRRAAVDREL